MPLRILRFDGGLVTSRDPSLLADGELTRADDTYYKPNDPAIYKALGRAAFNGTPLSSAVVGARYLEFEGATDVLVAHSGTIYSSATAATSGTFADLVTGLVGGSHLDSIHYNNEHVLVNGTDRARVIPPSLTPRNLGMLQNTYATGTISLGGTGLTLTANSTLTYWIEEQVRDAFGNILRRSASTSDATFTLTGAVTDDTPTITRVALTNSDATHWEVFATETNGSFPVGASIGSAAIATTTIADTRTGTDPGLPTGDTYEVVTATVAGVSATVPKWGQPPTTPATGDIFEDSLVLDDGDDATRIRYSYPDDIDAFPSFNFIRFETKEADEVKCIRALGRSLIVLLRDSVWRIDTLPRPEDSAFQIERIKEQIHGAHGCVGPMAAVVFSFGQGIRLAYVSRYGILVTDGFDWDVLTDDLDWPALVEISQLANCRLINNPTMYRLELDYTPAGGTVNTKTLFLHYHPSHAKTGSGGGFRAKVTGPINRAARSSVLANVSGEHLLFTGNADGKLYLEDSGNTDASAAGGIAEVVQTGDIYIAGFGSQGTINRIFIHHSTGAPGQSATVRTVFRNEGVDDAQDTEAMPLTRREGTATQFTGLTEALQIGVENSDALGSFGLNFIGLDVEPFGPQKQPGG